MKIYFDHEKPDAGKLLRRDIVSLLVGLTPSYSLNRLDEEMVEYRVGEKEQDQEDYS